MVIRLSVQELAELIATDFPHISENDQDEMAIPSYLHKNPLVRWLMWKRYKRIAQLCELTTEMSVLEFGCGIGVFLPELSRRCGKVYAIDLFPEYAKALSRKLKLNVQFLERLEEIPNDCLDLIIAADVLEHLNDRDRDEYLSIFTLKLKDNGRLILSGPTENRAYKAGRIAAGFGGKGDYHKTDIDDLIVKVIKFGFVHLRLRTLPFFFPPFLFKVCEFKKYRAGQSVT